MDTILMKDNSVELKDNHLYITYEYYDFGYQTGRKIIPVEDIECIKATVGTKGGMHTWSIRGYHPEYSEKDWNKDKKRDIEIYCGDRKDSDLIDKVMELLPDCKYYETVESGGAGW
jgi:hypothetical protein